MRKAFVTGCNLPFLEGAEPLLRGAREFHPDVERYCIVPEDEAVEAEQRLSGLAHVVPMARRIRGVPDHLQIAVAKVLLTTFTEDLVAWFDCDMLFCRPAPEIWEIPPGRVNAVRDTAYRITNMVPPALQGYFDRQFPGVGEMRGFNGGLFSLRPAEWAGLPERYEAALAEGGYPFYPPIFDQPLLNALFLPNVNWLPFSYNSHHLRDYRIPADVRIVHFTNSPKPWMPGYPKHEPAYYYWIRHGLNETRPSRLWPIRLKIALRTPRRLLARSIRSRMAGVERPAEMR